MAFIPDNSFNQRFTDKISPLLWEFYQYLCIRRNHETRISSVKIDDFIQLYGYKRASKFNLAKEIKNTNWIGGEDGKYILLVGDFSPVNKKADERKDWREKSKKIDEKSKKIDEKSKKIDSYNKEVPASLPALLPAEEIHTNATALKFNFPLKNLFEAFPDIQLTPSKARLIEDEVKAGDEVAWAFTLQLYVRNHDPTRNRYLPEKVGNLLSVFKSEKQKLEKQNSGNNTKSKQPIARNDERINNTNAVIEELLRRGNP